MERYNITGMSCAACSARVEKAVSAVKGVETCSVNLLTNSMTVDGTAPQKSIIFAVEKAGYGAEPIGIKKSTDTNKLKDGETPKLKKRLLASLIFLVTLMYFSMGHTMLGLPLPTVLDNNYIAISLIELLLTTAVIVINQRFFISGFKGVLNRSPNMDTLVALGSSASYIYSIYAIFAMTSAQLNGNFDAVAGYMHELYFESSAMILTLITVGKMLEARSKGKTTDALKGLINLAPKTAVILKNGAEIQVSISEVKKGDVFVLRPGQAVPVDGIVIDGESAVDESSLTGESIPVDKTAGDTVSAGTINKSGYIRCEAYRVGEDTMLSQIIKTVSDASASKAPVAKIADKVSGVFVPVVILIAIVTFAVWMLVGKGVGFSIARAVCVLVISCPCALGLATPVAIMVGNGVGAKQGILFKTAVSLEKTGKVNIAVLDKTGTITLGEPKVTDILPADDFSETELLALAFSLESKSEHPLARAIVQKATELNIALNDVDNFISTTGSGVSGQIDGRNAAGGNLKYIETIVSDIPDSIKNKSLELSKQGKTPMIFVKNDTFAGAIAVADIIKPESATAVKELQNMGIRVVMLTGDNENTAKAIAKEVGITEVISGVLPEGKEKAVSELKKDGVVAMVGDGINDSPALTRADIGIAIGAGTDIAIDAADIVLMKSNLSDVPAAIRLSRATLRNIRQNLFWAFIYNVIGIPLAAGVWYPVFSLLLNPMFGAAAMSLSSVCVVANALRLNLTDIRNNKHDKKIKFKISEEEKIMEKTVKIEGMMCPHCEARVKKLFESFSEVDDATVSHEKGTAVLKLNAQLSDDKIKSAIEADGYKVID